MEEGVGQIRRIMSLDSIPLRSSFNSSEIRRIREICSENKRLLDELDQLKANNMLTENALSCLYPTQYNAFGPQPVTTSQLERQLRDLRQDIFNMKVIVRNALEMGFVG